ncbi:autotransporter family protein [Candidatus Thiodiazotropha sp. CDECU1]|uniref:autotransporter family protein n=1 Tax=Candidatus Thiodiazotropha sp. CDECU1 TaxID=3065865 RepID=UPI00292CC1F1|nr:autotransporter domain-containing protein [Candidatus Thiodiazotropha sp. CDECU1]
MLFYSFPSSLEANDIQLSGLSQSPPNSVSVGIPITYSLTTSNVDDGINPASAIGISIRMRVDGTVIRADSGEIDAVGCSLDTSFPEYFACNDLQEGGTQTPSFTWNNPSPGNHTVTFEAACQLVPAQTPPVFCTSLGTSISTTTMVGAYPSAVLNPAGPTVNVDETTQFPISFNGLSSTDSDGNIDSCEFRLDSGAFLVSSTCTIQYTTLTPGDHTLDLQVTDNHGLTDIDSLTIHVLSYPEVDAGPDQSLIDSDNSGSENVALDGSGSSDVGGSIISYEWFEFDIQGSTIATGVTPTIALAVGTHNLTLRVTDDDGMVTEDQVVITILPAPNAPNANAGPDQQLTDADNNGLEDVLLDGTGSMDSDGTIVSYVWLEQGSQIATGATPTVALAVGEHTITLRVTDNSSLFSEDQVLISVAATSNAPIANAGQDQTLTDTDGDGSEQVNLDATGSSDPDGNILSYQWFENGTEIASGATVTITLPEGNHTLTLRVTDNDDLVAEDQVIISIISNTLAPIANAGPDQTLVDTDDDGSASVALDGAGSTDPDGSIVSYQWLEGSNEIGTGATPTVVLSVGVHTLTLRVTDDVGLTHQDQVTITIRGEEKQLQIISGSNLTGSSGETVGPFTVQLVDLSGSPVVDRTIVWSITPANAATLSDSESTTDQDGQASTNMTIQQTSVIKLIATLTNVTTVEFTVNSIAEIPGLTDNQQAIGSTMDNLCPSLAEKQATGNLTPAEQDLLMTCDTLVTDTGAASTLSRLAPEEVAAQGTASIEAASTQHTNIRTRLVALRRGDIGLNLQGLTVNIKDIALNSRLFDGLYPQDKKALGGAAGDSDELQGRWGAFINGNVNFGEKDETQRETGFDFDTSGITLGLDYRFSDKFVAGGALGFSRYDSEYNDAAGNLEMDAWSLSAYGTYYQDNNIYIDALIQLGSNSYDTRRRISTAGEPDQFGQGDTDGMEYAFNLSAGYEYRRDALILTPYGRLSYTSAEIDAYTEQASNPAAAGFGSVLRIEDQELKSMVLVVGGNVSYTISTANAVLMPQLRFEWEHEFEDDSRFINARFVNDPTSSLISIETDEADSDYFNLGIGLSAVFARGRSGYLFYETRLDQDDVTLHMINAGLRIEF